MTETKPADLSPEVRELDGTKLEALVEVMFLAAYADGEFSADERGHFAKSVESLTDRRVTGPLFDELCARLEGACRDGQRAERLRALRDVLSDQRSRVVALSLAIQLVAADGIVRTSERELLLDVAEGLDIDRDVAADLVKKIAPASV
jgi:tellurite resistance protein